MENKEKKKQNKKLRKTQRYTEQIKQSRDSEEMLWDIKRKRDKRATVDQVLLGFKNTRES